jgi:hypothetical protein
MERVDYQSLIIQDIINLEKQGELNLNPWYQRRSVWNDSQKSYLINTLFERKPIPTIYIRHSIDMEKEKSVKEIVDGQQRIRAILSFCKNEISAIYPETDKRIKYNDMSNIQKQSFLMTPLPIGYLQGATDSDVIDIFARINSVSKSLNSQEKRNAKYSGYFKQFCIKESTKRLELFRNYGIFTANDFARMNEVQFMSDVIVNLLDGLTSYNSGKLDRYYKENDENFDNGHEISIKLDQLFNVIISLDSNVIKNTIFNRPPLFFSLLIVVNNILNDYNIRKIEQGLIDIDALYNNDIPIGEKDPRDTEFYNAVSATTQGKEQREIRDKYIKRFIL